MEPDFVVSGQTKPYMNKTLITLLLLASTLVGAHAQIKLFNGKDLTGWKVAGTEKWYVEKGEMICESGPDKAYGYLVSEREFKNFELTVEF